VGVDVKIVSLFAGIGGFDKAFENAGYETVGQIEIDPWCQQVLKRHWPDVPKHDDITTAHGMMFGPADVVTFGSPCQDLSVAGKRVGLDGARSGLFMEAMRFIREMRERTNEQYPKYALWENVPGALNSNGGRDFGVVLRGLAKLGALDIGWRVLDSRHFGVAQRRRRVFLVADFAGERAAEILFESEGVRRDTQAGRGEGQGVTAFAQGGFADYREGFGTLRATGSAKQNSETLIVERPVAFDAKAHQSRSMNPSGLSPALEAQQKVAVAYGIRAANTSSNDWGVQEEAVHTLDGASPHAATVAEGAEGTDYLTGWDCQEKRVFSDRGLAPTLSGSDGGGGRTTVGYVAYGIQDDATPKIGHDVMPTLRARDGAGSSGQYVSSPYAVRRLTPTECEKLQAFPPDWTRYTADGKEIPDTHRYRMCGNAVTVSTVEWIARRMADT
jgi:DNA (cytosine-5)-methyltransferase 1